MSYYTIDEVYAICEEPGAEAAMKGPEDIIQVYIRLDPGWRICSEEEYEAMLELSAIVHSYIPGKDG